MNLTFADIDEAARELDRDAVAKGGLSAFVKLAWSHVENVPLIWNWHMDAICKHYEAVSRGECRELVVNVPPGFSKSTLTNVFWCAWDWISNPERKWIHTSYSRALTLRDAMRCADLVNSDWFQARWGYLANDSALSRRGLKPFAIGDEERSARFNQGLYYTTHGGMRMSTMFGGQVTGFHADILVADDPIKPAEIQNGGDQARSALEKVSTRWTQTFSSRARNPGKFARVIIMQRLHENDLAGHAITNGAVHVRFPMEFEPESRCATRWARDPRREPGELLCGQRVAAHDVALRKAGLSARDWASQYQQRPSPEQGALFQRAWCERRWSALPSGIRLVMSVDATFKDSASSDFAVCQVWGVHGPDFYLVDQVRARMDISATMRAIRDLRAKWPRIGQILVEDKANGSAIVSLLRREIGGILAVEPEGGKYARANAVEPWFRAGNVLLPEAPWVGDYVEELVAFPTSAHDDQVDATSQALNFLSARSHPRNLLQKAMAQVGAASAHIFGPPGRAGLVS